MPRIGLFLDRDGVLNINTHYPHLIEDLYLAPTVIESFKLLKEHEVLFPVIVSNQSGVGRGYFTKQHVLLFDTFLSQRIFSLTGYSIPQDVWYRCYSDSDHPWRKPNPGMLVQASIDHEFSLEESFLIGDRDTDIQAASNAHCRKSFLVNNPQSQLTLLDSIKEIIKLI